MKLLRDATQAWRDEFRGSRSLVVTGLVLAASMLFGFQQVVSGEVQRDRTQPPFASTQPSGKEACEALRDGHDDVPCTPPVDAIAFAPSAG